MRSHGRSYIAKDLTRPMIGNQSTLTVDLLEYIVHSFQVEESS